MIENGSVNTIEQVTEVEKLYRKYDGLSTSGKVESSTIHPLEMHAAINETWHQLQLLKYNKDNFCLINELNAILAERIFGDGK